MGSAGAPVGETGGMAQHVSDGDGASERIVQVVQVVDEQLVEVELVLGA